MDYEIVNKLALERGFYAQSCEIYGDSQAGFWDYGPLGLSLRNKYLDIWRKEILHRCEILEIDGTIIMTKNVFKSSGHLDNFVDPIVKCMKCKSIFRVDQLIEKKIKKKVIEGLSNSEFDKLIKENDITCSSCNSKLNKCEKFNMMFKIGIGPAYNESYLRPETCQSIFLNFHRLYKTMRLKLPTGIAQIGKSFRNEISPRQSFLRLREFYQAEIEIFFNPNKIDEFNLSDNLLNYAIPIQVDNNIKNIKISDALSDGIIPNKLIGSYLGILHQFYSKTGLNMNECRFRILENNEPAFYASFSIDFEVKTSLGWIELVACNNRTDYDLKTHSKGSNTSLTINEDNEKIIPHIFELSMGVDRSIYSIMEHSLINDGERRIMKFNNKIAPIQIGIFPLMNKEEISKIGLEIKELLKIDFNIIYDKSGSIGRRYRRVDEIGVPISITIDYQTIEDNTVTIRDRDSMKQMRVKIDKLKDELNRKFS